MIKRIGLYLIWSEEHGAWWAPDRAGYTRSILEAGRYSFAEADRIVTEANAPLICSGDFNELLIADPLEEIDDDDAA